MTEKYDFHCHSCISDGALSPSQVIQRAHDQGVTMMALTDHDTVAGYSEAKRAADTFGMKLIAGIELSTSWHDKSLHIIGLDIDPNFEPLRQATLNLQKIRLERAEKISEKLEKKKIYGAFDAVTKAAGDGMITRSHFADFLLSQYHVSTQQEAFDRYLAKGKPAYVSTQWADMETSIGWIIHSGGIAVLAHPLRYKLTTNWMKRLLVAFKASGGRAIEVVTGRSNPDEIRTLSEYALTYEFTGSVGSDFHSPSNPWVELGRLAPLPAKIKPVWDDLSGLP
jgi:predicted metal-dependent phosphoesterase TrpH